MATECHNLYNFLQPNPYFGRIAAARRVARSIFFGSVPTLNSTNKGIEVNHIKLACALPGQTVAIYGDALRRLAGDSTYLNQNDTRYWYSTQQTVTRLAKEKAAQYHEEDIYEDVRNSIPTTSQKSSHQDPVPLESHRTAPSSLSRLGPD